MTLELTGQSIIGYKSGSGSGEKLEGLNPATGENLKPLYYAATNEEVNEAASLAASAFESFSRLSPSKRAEFLRQIAANIEALGDVLTERASAETGLPVARIQGESARTCGQLRLFADLVSEGSWVDARIDRAMPERKPLPRPDIRSMLRPVGPVVVFCASNFPLAFSVAGGDTASAFAAGCTVIVKAHHAHPGTAEMVGQAVRNAAKQLELPDGVFSLLYGSGTGVGVALVKHPLIKAGGFTGSRSGGRALFDAASSRPEPIPFYAEMSSVNPVFILPEAMSQRTAQIAQGLHGSVTLGAGQFCTKPGLVFVESTPKASEFASVLGGLMATTPEFTMLTPGIRSSYEKGVSSRVSSAAVATVARKEVDCGPGKATAGTALFETNAESYLGNSELSEEVFGPSTLLIKYSGREQMLHLARTLEGHLTATVHGTDNDMATAADLIAILEDKVGRIVFNGYPTGVEVCHAMVHGGPYPATTDGRSTSVGTRAIFRFTRQICYQSSPDIALPDELKAANPLGIWRLVDGELSKDS